MFLEVTLRIEIWILLKSNYRNNVHLHKEHFFWENILLVLIQFGRLNSLQHSVRWCLFILRSPIMTVLCDTCFRNWVTSSKNFLRFPHFGGPFKEGTPRLIFEIVICDDISILTQYFQICSDILLLCLFVRQTFCTIMFATIFSRIRKCRIRLFETGHHGNLILSILMV